LELSAQIEEIERPLLRRRGVRWWTDRTTRPLLRALFGTMLCQWHLGRAAEAAEMGHHLLETDPDDHMGARFYVPLLLLLAGENEEASLFFRHYAVRYPGDMPHAWLSFAWGLTLCLEGDDQGARQKYREGIMANIHIAPRLLGERPPPEDIYHPSERDEPNSAVEFAGSFGGLWDREAAALRDAYGRNTFGQSLLLARRLVEAGTKVVEVIWPKVANSDNHSWDHHVGLDKRMKDQSAPMLDQGLSAFLADMDDRGLLDDTLVVAVGEFGRSPQKGVSTSGNGNSADGRDHRPYCFSAIVAGAGTRRGYVHGKSDATASAPLDDAVHPMQLLATIYHACGIEPETIVYNHLNQPRELVKAEAVTKLFG
jgi:hypothetical protein